VKGEALADLRRDLVATIGADAAAQTAATVAAFSGLVRVADGTGIPIDEGLASASVDIRKDLDLETFSGAANSVGESVGVSDFVDVDALWKN
jgi:hypothetical protein